jgi:hypothetical protein
MTKTATDRFEAIIDRCAKQLNAMRAKRNENMLARAKFYTDQESDWWATIRSEMQPAIEDRAAELLGATPLDLPPQTEVDPRAPLPPDVLAGALQDRAAPASGKLLVSVAFHKRASDSGAGTFTVSESESEDD